MLTREVSAEKGIPSSLRTDAGGGLETSSLFQLTKGETVDTQ